ncbi:MAG: hypothetical protein LUG12_03485 [Erysipelotrichaceae bacterium]|nr:hypothetical protein [Erysipelotrichaceae bacterium]
MSLENVAALKFKEDERTISYYYEDGFIDKDKSGILEIDKSVFDNCSEDVKDYFFKAADCYFNNSLRVIKVCQNPSLSGENEDFAAVVALKRILEYYHNKHEIPPLIMKFTEEESVKLMENPELKKLFEKYGIVIE